MSSNDRYNLQKNSDLETLKNFKILISNVKSLKDKTCSEGWMHIKLRPGTCNGSPISRTEGVTLYADVKKFNLLKDLKLDYYGDLSGGGFLISTPKNAKRCSCGSGFKLLQTKCAFFCKLILFSLIGCYQDKMNKMFLEIKFAYDRDE